MFSTLIVLLVMDRPDFRLHYLLPLLALPDLKLGFLDLAVKHGKRLTSKDEVLVKMACEDISFFAVPFGLLLEPSCLCSNLSLLH